MKRAFWFALALLGCAVSGHASTAELLERCRPAIVHIGNEGSTSSGVCVHPDGWILTAAHCVTVERQVRKGWGPTGTEYTIPSTVTVRFAKDEPRLARVVRVHFTEKNTDVAVIKVERKGCPFLPIAPAAPKVADQVVSLGYPNGNLVASEANVTGVEQSSVGTFLLTDHRVAPGHSGGPLLTLAGQVCGIAARSTTDVVNHGQIQRTSQRTMWATWEAIQAIAKETKIPPADSATIVSAQSGLKVRLSVWGSLSCQPCVQLKDDWKHGLIVVRGKLVDDWFDIEFHSKDDEQAAAAAAGIVNLPTILNEETGARISGYTGPEQLAVLLEDWLPPEESPPRESFSLTPKIQSPPPDEVPEKIDGDGFRVVLLVPAYDWGTISFVMGIVDQRFLAPVLTGIGDRFGKGARVDSIFERLEPTRFRETMVAAGCDPEERGHLVCVCLVPKLRGIGGGVAELLKGFFLNGFSASILKNAEIKVVPQRTQPDTWQAISEAADKAEPASDWGAAGQPQTWLTGVISFLAGLFHLKKDYPALKQKGATAT